jgi:hypothetical protein
MFEMPKRKTSQPSIRQKLKKAIDTRMKKLKLDAYDTQRNMNRIQDPKKVGQTGKVGKKEASSKKYEPQNFKVFLK